MTGQTRKRLMMKAAEVNLKMQFSALQFSDTEKQQQHDIEKLFVTGKFAHRAMIKGGTEAGKPALRSMLRDAATFTGHKFLVQGDCWLAVDKHLIQGGWDQGWVKSIDSREGFGKHSDRGTLWGSFENEIFGRISIGVGHKLKGGREPGNKNYELNKRMNDDLAAWGKEAGRGGDLAFYMGDENNRDDLRDVFMGAPFTTAGGLADRYPNTGHGPIDVIAKYDLDGRVNFRNMVVLNDKKMFLYTDHFPKVVTWGIEPIAA